MATLAYRLFRHGKVISDAPADSFNEVYGVMYPSLSIDTRRYGKQSPACEEVYE